MSDLKTIWLCAYTNFKKWQVNPRIYSVAVLIVAFSLWEFGWISDYAKTVGSDTSPWVFPYLLNAPIMFAIVGCLTTLLFCDAPFADSHTPFLIVRMSRQNWIIGQLLYIVLTSFVYSIFYTFMTIIALIPNMKFTLDWGPVLKTIAFNPESVNKYGITAYTEIGDPIISIFSAVPAMLVSFGLFWLVSVFFGILIFTFNIVVGRMSGLIAAGIISCMGYFSVYVGKISFGRIIYYVSPLNWSNMFYLDWSNTGKMPSPMYAVVCLITLILVMSIVSVIAFCKNDLSILERGN